MHDAAFGQADEGSIVDRLRGTADWIEGGSLVAVELAGKVLGHLLLSRGVLVEGGAERSVWMVGPVAVLPEWQSRGIGSSLMKSAIALTVECGVPLLLLLGHADYYPRFGFESARCLGIEPPQPWPDETWLALPLPGWTPDLLGVARYAPAFGVG